MKQSFAGLILITAAAAGAQLPPAGPELQINDSTAGDQQIAWLARGDGGGFVVTWTSYDPVGRGPIDRSIQARRFDSEGLPLGPQFQVDTYTYSVQWVSQVASDDNGDFVVVWWSDGSPGTDSSDSSVQARRYAADGTPLGDQFQVNNFTTGAQTEPAVAVGPAGGFVVAWRSFGSATQSYLHTIQAQRFDADGAPLGAQFQVSSSTTAGASFPALALGSLGGFVVAWQSYDPGGFSGLLDGYNIRARRYAADGAPIGSEFRVNDYTSGSQRFPSVAVDGADGFVVAWESDGSAGTDSSGYSVQARRFGADGTPRGPDLQVNELTTGSQRFARVASSPDGGFVVTWTSEHSTGSDDDGLSIQARRFGASGLPLGDERQVNTFTSSEQRLSHVLSDRDGGFVIAWGSDGSNGTDSDGYSIQAQRYRDLFLDGFETGDAARWSSTMTGGVTWRPTP